MEKRPYSIRWTQDETERFIQARIKLEHLFTGKMFDIKTSWEKVGLEAEINEDNWRKLKKKWTNLIDRYKTIIEPPTGMGTEDSGPKAATWPYFEMLHEYCSARHNINPPLIIETGSDDIESASNNINEPSTSQGRKRKRADDQTDDAKQLKLLERATKLYIKYMSTLVELSSSDDSDIN